MCRTYIIAKYSTYRKEFAKYMSNERFLSEKTSSCFLDNSTKIGYYVNRASVVCSWGLTDGWNNAGFLYPLFFPLDRHGVLLKVKIYHENAGGMENENENMALTGKDAPTAQSVTDKTTAVPAAGIAGTQTRRGIFLRWSVCRQQRTDGLDGLRRAADWRENGLLMQAKGSVPPILAQRRFWSVCSYHKTLPDSLSLRGWLTNR